ncbi:Protocadherin-11 Y-linked [Fasciola gigantica]|uniref:Protocadherin-11 Y-linked n=1 Tax=Fasciola gigantica TaxID=46835 RepID=A0A504YM25_FASGI|nr:Protocadherin-11 Y-linked [Fasciola gigantica]
MVFCVSFVFICAFIQKGELTIVPNNPHRVQFHLADNTPPNHVVGNILGGVSLGQPLSRAMVTPDTWFRVTNAGDLFTRDSLDRDLICVKLECCQADFCQIHLEAYLFHSGPTPTTVRIALFVADENDNAPQFPQLSQKDKDGKWWRVFIPESAAVGTKHALPAATDADSARFGIHHYKLFSARSRSNERLPFSLVTPASSYTAPTMVPAPQLQIDRPLDRETRPSYDLFLVVEDAGSPPLTTTLSVRVILLDTNDNAPIFFNQTDMSVTIPESTTIGTVIHQFYVRDLDDGPNGNVTLSIDWPASLPGSNQTALSRLSSKYLIHPYTGELRVAQSLDYEDELERKLVLVIRAADSGSPQQTASAILTITLTDVNDNGPTIEVLGVGTRSESGVDGTAELADFKENDPDPQLLRLISVSDPDSVSAGKLSCKLSDRHQGQTDFVLTSYSDTMYGLVNARAFDYEREASQTGHLSVSIECTDEAEPKKTRQQWIQINLIDVNDNWPQFSQANYEFRVAENTEPGTDIGVVQAIDADSGFNGQVTYRLTTDKTQWLNLIRIDPKTGTVYVNAMLDRESMTRLDFHVTASDGDPSYSNTDRMAQKTNTTGLTIIITDVNDNAPSCMEFKEVHVIENAPIGTQVLKRITVSDPDAGSNGSVTVSLIERPYMYSINMISHGVHSASTIPEKRQHLPFVIKDDLSLITSGSLDREQQTQFVLTLLVKDHGVPIPLSTTCTLTIVIDDVNDNSPQLVYPRNNSFLFGQREHSEPTSPYARSSVPANTPYGSRIITVRGKDPDAGANGTVNYYLLPHENPIPNDSMMTLMMTMEISTAGHNGALGEDEILVYRDGMHFFNLDKQTGLLTTAWGQNTDQYASKTADDTTLLSNTTDIGVKHQNIEQPEPGLYSVVVELRDMSSSPLTSKAVFFVNISEPVSMGFAFGLFSETNLSNTVILVLIMVCSLALIISLTAAIFWVRFRNDNPVAGRQNSHTFGSGYNGPTVITHDSMPNGYFYPANYPSLGSPTDLSEIDPRFMDSTLIPGKDGTIRTNWTELNLDTGQSPDYQVGMYGGSLIPSTVDGAATFQLCTMNKPDEASTAVYPSGIHLIPVSGNDHTELTVYQTGRAPSSKSNWLPCTDSYATDPTMIIRMDGGYGPVECMGIGQATNNSTGGSDSGVDSGAGVALGTIASSSPTLDGRGRTSHLSNPIGKPGITDHLHSSTVPRSFFTRDSPTPLSTNMADMSTHNPETVNGHKEPHFHIGSSTPHTMHLVHQPNSSLGHTMRRAHYTDSPAILVGTINRLKTNSHSGILVSEALYSNGTK